MGKLIALLAGLVLAATPREAEAATFTPDMWVYEVTLEATEIDSFQLAWIDAAPGTPVPAGCSSTPEAIWEGVPYITITCDQNPGIDLFEPYDGRDAFTRMARIGFNATTVVCDDQLVTGCPPDGRDTEEWNPSAHFTNVLLDATLGTLSYCGSVLYAEQACYDLSPDAVSNSVTWVNIGWIGGDWNYFGQTGRWYGYSPDSVVRYSATGRLVSSPSVVPLPVPALMLGSALAALGLMAQGGLRRRRPAPPPMG